MIKLNSGHQMPRIGIGTFQGKHEADTHMIADIVYNAIKIGYRKIDTAQVYFSEDGVGLGIQRALKEGIIQSRDELFIITKLWATKNHPEKVVEGMRESLKRLMLDYLDLFLIHWPCALQYSKEVVWPKNEKDEILFDNSVDYLHTWKAMEGCVKDGFTKSIGVSNFRPKQLQRILDSCTIRPAYVQSELHPYLQDEKLRNFCQNNDIALDAYSPFMKGDFSAYISHHNIAEVHEPMFRSLEADLEIHQTFKNPVIQDIAQAHEGKTTGQIILRFLLQLGYGVIAKSANISRMKENLIDPMKWKLTEDEMKRMRELDMNLKVVWIPLLEPSKYYPFKNDSI